VLGEKGYEDYITWEEEKDSASNLVEIT